MKKINVGIVGATGYAGVELVRLLLTHPYAQLKAISSVSFEGKKLSQVYPCLYNIVDLPLESVDLMMDSCDIIFGSLPHGLSEDLAKDCVDRGIKFVDLGADFRLDSEEEYIEWYGKPFAQKEMHNYSVYSIPELHRNQLQNCKIVANPGCYPTSVALGLAPILTQSLDMPNSIVVDSKSGVTGAGRSLSDNTHFPACNEAFSAYKVANHRHLPEIEQTLTKIANKKINITFVPHLLPINRGILSTMYVGLNKSIQVQELYDIYKQFYKNEKFVRVLPLGEVANVKNVKMSNYCDISIHLDTHTNRAVIVSAIDNMVKGASGQAVQNMNILFGWKEDCGLEIIPPAF